MERILSVGSGVSALVLLASAVWMAALDSGGPARRELTLDGGIPGTLYFPWTADSPRPSEEARPPAVVLSHGFASDRLGMSGLARALTQAGYAVLSIELRGHGENRNAFTREGGHRESLVADMRAAVDFLRGSRDVDGARISVMGHSMGAGVALEYAGLDPAIDAAVMISGGRRLDGPQRPANALFIYAAGDPERTRRRAAGLAAELAGEEALPAGDVRGDFANSTAVSHVEVARTDHITILSSSNAARQMIDWLDRSYGVERGTFFLRSDSRLAAAGIGMLAFVLALPGLGLLVGRLGPRLAERPAGGALARGALLVAALLLTLPLVAVGGLEHIVPLVVANQLALHWLAAGSAVLVWLAARGALEVAELRAGLAASLPVSAVAVVAVAFGMAPFAIVLHGLGLTPERAAAGLLVALWVLPFQVAFHELLRRGGFLSSTLASLAGRVVVVGVIVAAVRLGVLPGVVMIMLPVLALLFVLFEVLAASVYAASRNARVPALVESAWLGWILGAILPITV